MYWLIAFPAIGIVCGAIASALTFEAYHRRWLALMVAFLAPMPVVYAIMGAGYAFMREEADPLASSVYGGIYLFGLISPFSVLAAWFVCHRKSRPQ